MEMGKDEKKKYQLSREGERKYRSVKLSLNCPLIIAMGYCVGGGAGRKGDLPRGIWVIWVLGSKNRSRVRRSCRSWELKERDDFMALESRLSLLP